MYSPTNLLFYNVHCYIIILVLIHQYFALFTSRDIYLSSVFLFHFQNYFAVNVSRLLSSILLRIKLPVASTVLFFFITFSSIWVFFRNHSRVTGLQAKRKGISLTPHYHFHPLHRHLDINWAITTESSPHRQQPDSNQESLVSAQNSLTTKLRAFMNCPF